MKNKIAVLVSVALLVILTPPLWIETANGERRLRYLLCDEHHNCRIVEQTMSYLVCNPHHECRIVKAGGSAGKGRVWEQEELVRSGRLVFAIPGWG